jgi:hypothetical protein
VLVVVLVEVIDVEVVLVEVVLVVVGAWVVVGRVSFTIETGAASPPPLLHAATASTPRNSNAASDRGDVPVGSGCILPSYGRAPARQCRARGAVCRVTRNFRASRQA